MIILEGRDPKSFRLQAAIHDGSRLWSVETQEIDGISPIKVVEFPETLVWGGTNKNIKYALICRYGEGIVAVYSNRPRTAEESLGASQYYRLGESILWLEQLVPDTTEDVGSRIYGVGERPQTMNYPISATDTGSTAVLTTVVTDFPINPDYLTHALPLDVENHELIAA